MKRVRLVCAIVVLCATAVGVLWLATYRVDMLVADGRRGDGVPGPISFTRVHGPVWWGAYTATILLVLGVGLALRVLQSRLRPAQRTSDLLRRDLAPEVARLRVLLGRSSREVLSGLDWLVAEPLRLLVKR
jgi:TRAP-type C4-dicarboxylate transport system permease small subunit